MGTLRTFAFDCLSFLVAHIFLVPAVVLALEVWLIATFGWLWAGTPLAILNVAYLTTYFDGSPHTGKRFWPEFVPLWLGCHQYFGPRGVRTLMWDGSKYADEPNEGHRTTLDTHRRPFVFAMHPHGAIPLGGAVLRPQLSRWPHISDNLRVGAATAVFALPIVRDFYLWFGTVLASWRTLEGQLKRGNSILLLPGGIKEQLTVCKATEELVFVRERTGFVKLALAAGAPIVPVYVFGERRGYVTQELITRFLSPIVKHLCRAGVPCVRGRWFTLMPFPVPITIVVGKPIPVPNLGFGAPIPDSEVEAVMRTYVAALQQLYDEHKEACGYGSVPLVIQ